MSPIAQVRPDAPPMLMIAARSDNLIPQQSVAIMADALCEAGAQGSLAFVLSGAQHAYDGFSSASAHYHINAVRTWLETVHTQLNSRPVETLGPTDRAVG
jgi:acetyl esterase/lipase